MLYRLVLALCCLFPLLSHAAELPIDVSADKLDMNLKQKKAVFAGNVVVVRGDMTLTASTLTLRQKQDKTLDNMVAEGNVQLKRGTDTATGQTATYTPGTQLLILQGNVKLKRGSSTLTGDTLRYDMADGTLKLNTKKGGARVKAVVDPSQLNK